MSIGRELFHARSDLRQNRDRRVRFDAGHRLQQSIRGAERFHIQAASNLLVQRFYFVVQEVKMAESVSQQETVMVGEAIASQGGSQLRNLLLCLSLCQLRDRLGGGDSFQKRADHEATRESEHVAENVPELDVGVFEDLLHAIVLTSFLPDQLSAPAGQISEFSHGTLRNEARPDHAMAKQMSEPAAVDPSCGRVGFGHQRHWPTRRQCGPPEC